MDGRQAHQRETRREAVAGLGGLRLSYAAGRAEAASPAPSAEEIELFVRGMLRLAAVPVMDEGLAGLDAEEETARLHTTVSVTRVVDLYSVALAVELWDRVWLTRQTGGGSLEAATWRETATLVSNRHELRENVRQQLGQLLTHFLNDYVAANAGDAGDAGGSAAGAEAIADAADDAVGAAAE